jgi:hypothetical protein
VKCDHSKEQPRQRHDRWQSQHGDGDQRARKKSFFTIDAAERAASRKAVRYDAYPCRWHDDYDRGETAAEHYHIGRGLTVNENQQWHHVNVPLRQSLADRMPPHLLGGPSGA